MKNENYSVTLTRAEWQEVIKALESASNSNSAVLSAATDYIKTRAAVHDTLHESRAIPAAINKA